MFKSNFSRGNITTQVQRKKKATLRITIFKTLISMVAAYTNSHVSDSPSAISKEGIECKQPPKSAVLTFLFTKKQHEVVSATMNSRDQN